MAQLTVHAKRLLQTGVIGVCASAAVLAGAVQLFTARAPLLKRVSVSSTKLCTALLITDNSSFGGADAWVFVIDTKKRSGPKYLGGSYASDGSKKMDDAVWSRDGSVLAVRARVGQGSGKGFRGEFKTLFVAAYDFRGHAVVATSPDSAHNSRRITKLLAARGGLGRVVFSSPYDASGAPISSAEESRFRRPGNVPLRR